MMRFSKSVIGFESSMHDKEIHEGLGLGSINACAVFFSFLYI